jgi:hypothetical protein
MGPEAATAVSVSPSPVWAGVIVANISRFTRPIHALSVEPLVVTEPSRGAVAARGDDAAVEDQADPVRAPGVEVVAGDVLEEHPPAHGSVQHLGQGEFHLQDRDLCGKRSTLWSGQPRPAPGATAAKPR